MKGKIMWVVLSCLIATAVVLMSCGPAAEEEEEAEVTPTEEPQYGGTLIVPGYTVTPYAWDPADCDWLQANICGPVYENLMMGDIQKGPRGTNEFEFGHAEWIPDEFLTGQLAESWELVPPNKIVWHLRKGVQWTGKEGVMEPREFTAQDAELALERYMVSPKSSVGRFNWVDPEKPTDKLNATDKYTLELEYTDFSADWSYLLGWGWSTDIYPPEVVTAGASDWRNIVGTGPFLMDDYVTGTSITYTRNPDYWQTATIGGKQYQMPLIDKLIYVIIVDESTRLASLRTAKTDVSMSTSWKFKDTLEQSNPDLLRWRRLSMGDFLVAMRVDTKPFDDRRVRLAMSMAVDRQTLAKNPYYEPTDNPILLHYPMGANYPESVYTPIEELPESAQEQFIYDTEKAKTLLAEAGYPDGFRTEMILHAYPDNQDLASMLAGMWEKINVEVELKPMEYAAFQSMFLSKTHKAMVFYSKGLVHPLTALRYNLPGQPWGPANWNEPQYEQDYLTAKATTDDVERNRILKSLNVQAIDAIGYIPLPANYYYIYAWPWVKNYYGESNLGYIADASQAWAQVWIDQELKETMGY